MTLKNDACISGDVGPAQASVAQVVGPLGCVKQKRPYAAPVLTAFGSVEEFTRGTGSKGLDSNRVSQMNTSM